VYATLVLKNQAVKEFHPKGYDCKRMMQGRKDGEAFEVLLTNELNTLWNLNDLVLEDE